MQEFFCSHPELMPTGWNQPKPVPTKMVGPCEHAQTCPVCGYGWGSSPPSCWTIDGNTESGWKPTIQALYAEAGRRAEGEYLEKRWLQQ